MVEASFSEKFLKGEDIQELKITQLKILEEPVYVKGKYGDQLQTRVQANTPDKRKFKWTMGAKANDECIKIFGRNTEDWIAKLVKVDVEKTTQGNLSVIVIGEISQTNLG